MRLIFLKLKGFRGIKRGMGLDTLEIDFTRLPSGGLISFVGENGRGKTTVLDNMHPYRVAPSRSGSYYDLCEGEAQKDLIFEVDGIKYRSLILIETKQKKQEAYLYQHDGEDWIPVNPDGKTTTYDAAVEGLLGSEKLFFLSVFRAQNAKPLSAHTKGELKDIFEELLMLDDIRQKGEKAKEIKKYLLGNRDSLLVELARLAEIESLLARKEGEKNDINGKISDMEAFIAGAVKDLESLDKEISRLSGDIVKQDAVEAALIRLKKDLEQKKVRKFSLSQGLKNKEDGYNIKLADKKKKLERVSKISDNGAIIREKLVEEEHVLVLLEKKKGAIVALETAKDELFGKISVLQNRRARVAELRKGIEVIDTSCRHAIEKAESEVQRARGEARKLEGLPCLNTDLLPACRFVKDAITSRDSLVGLEGNLFVLRKNKDSNPDKQKLLNELSVLEVEIQKGQVLEASLLDVKKSIEDAKKELFSLDSSLAEVRKYTKLLPELETAEATLLELEKELITLEEEKIQEIADVLAELNVVEADIKVVNDEIFANELNLDASLSLKVSNLQKEKAEKKKALNTLTERSTVLHTQIGAVIEAIKTLSLNGKALSALRDEVAALEQEISEWSVLEKALGKEGVIALEIDDAGPAISGIANDLLNSCFGSKFAVKIETTRPRKDGTGTMEVFDIRVIDTEQGEEKSLLDLSGGEKVWIEDAVTKAICLYNRKQSGKSVSTLFSDEKDGALDHMKKKEYLLMKKRMLELGGYEREFFITHSEDLQHLSDGRIIFASGGVNFS